MSVNYHSRGRFLSSTYSLLLAPRRVRVRVYVPLRGRALVLQDSRASLASLAPRVSMVLNARRVLLVAPNAMKVFRGQADAWS